MKLKENEQLVRQLREEKNRAFTILYQSYFPAVRNYILKNNGTREDAEDIFQEAVIVLMGKLLNTEFEFTSSVSTYLFAICKNLWLKSLRCVKQETTFDDDFWLSAEDSIIGEESFKEDIGENEKLVSWLMNQITVHCKQILDLLFFKNESIEKLMILMGWKNKHTANNQKYKCIQQAKKAASQKA